MALVMDSAQSAPGAISRGAYQQRIPACSWAATTVSAIALS